MKKMILISYLISVGFGYSQATLDLRLGKIGQKRVFARKKVSVYAGFHF